MELCVMTMFDGEQRRDEEPMKPGTEMIRVQSWHQYQSSDEWLYFKNFRKHNRSSLTLWWCCTDGINKILITKLHGLHLSEEWIGTLCLHGQEQTHRWDSCAKCGIFIGGYQLKVQDTNSCSEFGSSSGAWLQNYLICSLLTMASTNSHGRRTAELLADHNGGASSEERHDW
jgi:hypothetical protein